VGKSRRPCSGDDGRGCRIPHAACICVIEERELVPVSLTEAKRFVYGNHRHNKETVGWKFGVGLAIDGLLVGVAIVGRPGSRILAAAEPRTVEITRCTTTGEKNACSQLYGAACRMAKNGGYLNAITYTLASEPGTSLLAAGFEQEAYVPPEETHRVGRYVTNLFGEASRPPEGKWRWRRHLWPELTLSRQAA
jgi:hypothetical protein